MIKICGPESEACCAFRRLILPIATTYGSFSDYCLQAIRELDLLI